MTTTTKSIPELKKDLWKVFSRYIRERDGYICITCNKDLSLEKKNCDAGHFIPKTRGNNIYFDEQNVNAQCTSCNRYQHGKLYEYAMRLEQKYGEGILQRLEEKMRTTKRFTRQELIGMIELYRNKLTVNP
jgi:5-methylcytosine-specific restriction endonuclease McrA